MSMISNKSELDETILKVCQKICRPEFIEHHLDISNWYEEFAKYPITEKSVYDFLLVVQC